MTPTLAVYIFGYHLDTIKYPWQPCIDSALALTQFINGNGNVYYCHCALPGDDDNTLALIQAHFESYIRGQQLHILYHSWGDHHTIQAHICNYALDQIGESVDYALKLDADEVIHQDSFDAFKLDLEHMGGAHVQLGRPRYTHFCPDDKTTIPFIYSSKAVLSRTSSGFRFSTGKGGDACALGGAPEHQTNLNIYHYGKMSMGREKESLLKEWTFQQLYTDLGFPDPLVKAQWERGGPINYKEIFHGSLERGEFTPYIGSHPVFAQAWLDEMRKRADTFWRDFDPEKQAVK